MPVLDVHATEYSQNNALVLANAAAVVYSNEEACLKWARESGFDQDFDFISTADDVPNSDTQGFVAQSADAIIVAFRGTEPKQIRDWLSDVNVFQTTWGHGVGKVHKGFQEALQAAWGHLLKGKEILPRRLLERGPRTVWITGHSLGGALAELCAAQASVIHEVPVQGLYTFGQPRVG